MKALKILILVLTILAPQKIQAMPQVAFAEQPLENYQQIVVFANAKGLLAGTAKKVDEMTEGRLSQAIKDSAMSGAFGSARTFYGLKPFSRITVIGSGEQSLSQTKLQDLGGYAVAQLPANNKKQTYIVTDSISTQVQNAEAYMALGASLRDYHFDKYKKKSAKTTPRSLVFQSTDATSKAKYEQDLKYIAKGVYLARDMAWEPGKSIYPEKFVQNTKKAFKGIKNIDFDVLNVRDMKKLNMGALIGVGTGSVHDPRLLIIEYNGLDDDSAPIALVGKGITFDTGGISLKKNTGMWAMKADLSGAAAVAGTVMAVAARGEKVNLVGVIPLAENMPSGDAIRPGDVLTTMQGTSIEIISTDAEGRLILADAVRYAQDKFKPSMLLNIATLTGSAGRALSDEYAALVTRDWSLSEKMMDVGKRSGELVWPLPLHPNHFKQIKSEIADIKNSGAGNPGASIGAAVVATFIDKDLPWVHLDIAGVDWLNSDIAVAPKGSQGWGVRFMDQVIRDNAK